MSARDIQDHLMPSKPAVDHSNYTVQLYPLVRKIEDLLNDKKTDEAIQAMEQLQAALRGMEEILTSRSEKHAPHPVRYGRKFHEIYNHPIVDVPAIPSPARRLLRVRLLCEEVAEFCRASGFPMQMFFYDPSVVGHDFRMVHIRDVTPEMSVEYCVDIVEVADGGGDINVVANGAMLEWGIPIAKVDAEIHKSNMSKLGLDGKPITDAYGKTVKGPNYQRPDIEKVLREAGWQG